MDDHEARLIEEYCGGEALLRKLLAESGLKALDLLEQNMNIPEDEQTQR